MHLKGAQLFLGIQLIVVSFFKIFNKNIRNRILGFFTLFSGLIYFYNIFRIQIYNNSLLNIMFVGPLEVIDPALLYLYIALLNKPSKRIIKHLSFPVVYLLFYKVLFFFFKDVYDAQIQTLGIIHYFLLPFYFGIYFFKGIKIFKTTLQNTLKEKALKKFKIFYYSFNILNITSSLIIFVPILMMMFISTIDKDYIQALLETFSNSALIFGLFIYQLLILYALSESNTYKSFFLGIDVYKENN